MDRQTRIGTILEAHATERKIITVIFSNQIPELFVNARAHQQIIITYGPSIILKKDYICIPLLCATEKRK